MIIKGKERNLIFYDFEVFQNADFWLVVLINYETKEKTIIINNKNKLKDFYELHKEDIFIGYNNKNYDRWIWWGILLNDDPCRINKELIQNNKKPYKVLNKNYKNYQFYNYDVADIMHSLKQYEGFLGHMIKESDVPFDLDRALTEEEIQETIFYCTHDVEETIQVFEHKKGDFEAQKLLIDMYDDLTCDDFIKTKAQLTAFVLGGVKQSRIDDEFDFVFPHTLQLNKYKYIKDWFDNPRNKTYGRQLKTKVANNLEVTIGYGGIHGALPNTVLKGKIITHCDVASLYPSLMIVYDLLSRNVRDKNIYSEIKAERIKLKHAHDERQLPLKIVLNATYGILKDRNSSLFDPRQSNSVCICGQLLMLDLLEKIEHLGLVYQMNTDAINIAFDTEEQFKEAKKIASEWEKRTGLDLEWDIYESFYQRDVNNYVAFEPNGHIDSKGCMKQKKGLDYDLPIITKSILEYLQHGTPIEDYINNENRLIEFQQITKSSSLYMYSYYGTVKQIEHNGKKCTVCDKGYKISEKVNRIFASKDENDKGIYKVKNEYKVEKLAGTPDKCFINNEDVTNELCPDKLDKQWYIDLAKKTLADFLESEKKEVKLTKEQQVINVLKNNHKTFFDVLKDLKENTNVTKNSIIEFITIDAFKQYGKSKKLLNYYNLFLLLYNKKSTTNTKLKNNNLDIDDLKTILINNSVYNEEKGNYSKLNSEQVLIEAFNIFKDEDVTMDKKILQEFKLYNDCSLKDNNIDENVLFIMAVNDTHNPSIIAYSLKYGKCNIFKVPKHIFEICPIKEKDFIYSKHMEKKNKVKVIGKDEKGINLIGYKENEFEWWINQYDIIKRNVKFNEEDL